VCNGCSATFLALVLLSASPVLQDPSDFRNQSTNVITGLQLSEKHEWIWTREPGGGGWRKLIPGRCPQWQLDGKRFFYFLDVGYDGSRAELWSADSDGEARLRLTQSDYFINDGPVVVSPDRHSLAFVYHTSRASGDFEDVVVIDFRPSPLKPTDGRVVLRTRSAVDAHTLIWKGPGRLSVMVDGRAVNIDANAPGRPQDP
jgi:hypothetical protein